MSRVKGAKGLKIKDLFETTQRLKQRSEGKRPRWNNIMFDTGYNLERLGRQLFGLFGVNPKIWSAWEYAQLVQALRNCADVVEARAKAQDQKQYNEAINLLKE